MATHFTPLHGWIVSFACLGLVACGGADAPAETTGPEGGGTGLTGGTGEPGDLTFAGELSSKLCDWMLGCCTTTEFEDLIASMANVPSDAETLAMALELRADPGACQELVKGFVVDILRHADAAVLAGRASFDATGAATCLAHLDGGCAIGGAGDIGSDDHPCSASRIVTGLVAVGGLCTDHFECTDGGYCDVALGSSFGTCRSWAQAGSPCDDDANCGPSGYCGAPGTLGVCVTSGGTLAPYCNIHSDCDSGQYCATAIGSCVAALAEGTVCQGNAYCSTGYCALETTQVCETPAGLNGLCTADAACGATGYCDDTSPDVHRCSPVTQLGAGQRCGIGAAVCGEGLVCEDGLCVPRAGIGGPCQSHDYCPSNGYCDDGSCVQRAPIGGDCTQDDQCLAISWCDGGTCAERTALGQSCDESDHCEVNAYCDLEVGVVGTCKALPETGSDCVNGMCAPGFACVSFDGTCAARLEAGGDCQRTAMCTADHLCASPGLATDVCQPAAIVGAGEPCGSAKTTCNSGLFCSGGLCTAYAVAGGLCSSDDECVDGTSCVQGTCGNLGGAFAICDSVDDCSAGLFCDLLVQQCSPQKTKDQSCMSDDECQGTLYCDTSTWLCDWKKAQSQPCANQAQCQDGLYCNIAGSCATRLGVGETCNVDDACLDGLGCVVGLCTGPAYAGTTCNPVMGCVEGATCDLSSNMCVALATSGEACEGDSDCVTELFCGAVAPTCAPRATEGEACDNTDGCLPSLSCQQSGLCRARSGAGSACDPKQSQCVEGSICDASNVCVGLLADRVTGAPCRHDGQCITLTCESGLCVGHCQGDI